MMIARPPEAASGRGALPQSSARRPGTRALAVAVTGAVAYAVRGSGLTQHDWVRLVATASGDARRAAVLGRALYFASGAVLALAYATALRSARVPPSARSGAALGAAHGAVTAGALRAARRLRPPLRYAALLAGVLRQRSTWLTIVAGHAVFGACVGAAVGGADRRDLARVVRDERIDAVQMAARRRAATGAAPATPATSR